jgi:hypothetical protein
VLPGLDDAATGARRVEATKSEETTMINVQTAGAALALALAVAATATPALAKTGAAHRGLAAQAQAIEAVNNEGVSAERGRALRECNGRIASFRGYNQMSTPTAAYRTCMEQHGQPE